MLNNIGFYQEKDFLKGIFLNISGEGFSSHWVPYWRMCTPCHFKYDMIGKLETGFDDFTVRKCNFLHNDNIITELTSMTVTVAREMIAILPMLLSKVDPFLARHN